MPFGIIRCYLPPGSSENLPLPPAEAGTRLRRRMSVLDIVGPKRTLAASYAAPWCVTVSMATGQTAGRTDGRQTVTLRLPLDRYRQRKTTKTRRRPNWT